MNTNLSDSTDNSRTNTDLSDNTDNSRTNTDSLHSRVWRCESSDLPDNKFSNSLILENNKSVQSVKSVVPKIAIVESEKSAVILSEKFTDFVWLCCGGLQSFRPELLSPLVNYKVIIFPDTDSTGDTYRQWSQVATEAQRLYKFRYPLRVSRLLEDHASPEQKQRKIDLVDFLFNVPQKSRKSQK